MIAEDLSKLDIDAWALNHIFNNYAEQWQQETDDEKRSNFILM